MKLTDSTVEAMLYDSDGRADLIRNIVADRTAEKGPLRSPDHIVATYFVVSRAHDLRSVGEAISYYMTSGVHGPPAGSLLAECTGQVMASDAFDGTGRLGLVWVGFPVKMMQYEDGKVYTTDILNLMAGEGVFGIYDHADIQLTHLEFPDSILDTFPGPAYGAQGIRKAVNLPDGTPMFGTILKPTSGITPREVGDLVRAVAGNPLFCFAKEDENLIPGAAFCPLADRARQALVAIRDQADARGGRGLFFAPHITAPPSILMRNLEIVIEAGVNAVMFSDQFVGGTTRMVREATVHMASPPAIYAHNSGISSRTRSIWREVLDLLVRLDGADFRQTAPLTTATPFLRPWGREWIDCEMVLTKPLGHIKPVVIARGGGLDQGNIILNLHDAQRRGYGDGVLYLAGSAINAIKDRSGNPSVELGAAAMVEAVEAFSTGALSGDSPETHLSQLYDYALGRNKVALQTALQQRYPRLCPAN